VTRDKQEVISDRWQKTSSQPGAARGDGDL
jgi:hypothetical protein